MTDKEVGELWAIYRKFGTDWPRSDGGEIIQLILKLVEERADNIGHYDAERGLERDFDSLPKNEYGEVQYDQLALEDFGIDYQEYLACITKLQTK